MRCFTSDQHFGHTRITEFCKRPFGGVREMNAAVIEAHNAFVEPDDGVYLLGDLAFGDPRRVISEPAESLHGRLHLVPGNHDASHPIAHGHQDVTALCEQVGIIVERTEIVVDIAGTPALLCQSPPEGDSGRRDRYRQWRPVATDSGHARWYCMAKCTRCGGSVALDQRGRRCVG